MRSHFAFASGLAYILDNQFGVGKYRVGLSAFLDVIPGMGDIINAILSMYIVWIAIQMQVPPIVIFRMTASVTFNFVFGSIPVIGDAVYIVRKTNMKNISLIKKYAPGTVVEGEVM